MCKINLSWAKYDSMLILYNYCSDEESVEDDDLYQPKQSKEPKPETITLPQGINRRELLKVTTSTATRYKMSPMQQLAMVSSVISHGGGNMNDMVASISTAKRHRKIAQAEKASELKSVFKDTKPKYKIIHWDGKLVQFLNEQGGGVYQDANAIIISSPLELKPMFLAAPTVERGTGQLLCQATIRVLQDWDIMDNIIGTCWDTTAANTGIHEGAATHLEAFLEHAYLWLACRHHMSELHVKHVYHKIQGPNNGEYMYM